MQILALAPTLAALLPAQSWTQHSATGPSARYSHAMAYDAANGEVVIFGGYAGNGQTRFDDTWVWDGTSWEDVTPAVSPSPRAARMAYDPLREVVVLFGGSGTSTTAPESDTWEWDGAARTWTEITPATTIPAARFGHAMAYDGQNIVMVGGRDGTPAAGTLMNVFPETCVWDGSDWTVMPGPALRFHAMTYDSARERVVLFGGTDMSGTESGVTWEWNRNTLTWSQRTSRKNPSARFFHAMSFDSARGVTVLFGGRNPNNLFLDDTWEWNGSKWSKIGGSGPSARMFTAMAFDSARDFNVLFAGWGNGVILADTWENGPSSGGGGGGGGGGGRGGKNR